MSIIGTAENNTLIGTDAADQIYGFEGDDILDGGLGDDLLDGGAGHDSLNDGSGTIQCFGLGSGQDYCHLITMTPRGNLDTVRYRPTGQALYTADVVD